MIRLSVTSLRPRRLLPLIVLLLLSLQTGHAQREVLTLEEYRGWLVEARTLIEEARPRDALTQLRNPPAVDLPNGERIEPFGLGSERSAVMPEVNLVIEQMEAADLDRAREQYERFERTAANFQVDQPPLLVRFLNWIGDLFDRFFPDFSLGEGGPLSSGLINLTGWLVAVLGVVALVVLLGYWLSGSLGGVLNYVTRREQAETQLPTARSARHQASSFAAAGDYRQALRQLYLAALLHLHEAGALRYEEHRTNRELLAQIEGDPALYEALGPVVATFEPFWYGIRQPDRESFDRYQRQVDTLMATSLSAGDE